MSFATITSSSIQSINSTASHLPIPKDTLSSNFTSELKINTANDPSVDHANYHVHEVPSDQFQDLEGDLSHFTSHPLEIGVSTKIGSTEAEDKDKILQTDAFAPYKLSRVVGRSHDVPAINLTEGYYKSSVLYAASNVIILRDFFKNKQRCLQGHKNRITTLASDTVTRYFMSGDSGNDCCMIIWETSSLAAVKSFPNPHDGFGILNAAFSGGDNLLATVGAEEEGKQRIFMWNVENKESKTPLCTTDLPPEAGIQRNVYFSDISVHYFATIGDTCLLFLTWMKSTQTIYIHKPKVPSKFMGRMKKFTAGLWMNDDNWFVTTTMLGFAVVWEKPMGLGLKKAIDATKNIKEYKRSFKLSDYGITCFDKYKEYVVAGDERGVLRFFDYNFKIIRWTPTIMLGEPVTSVSFNLSQNVPDFILKMRSRYVGEKHHVHHQKNSSVKEYTFGGSKVHNLSETTIERQQLLIPDFILCVESGSLYYCHFMEGKVDLIIQGAPAPWVAFDVCPLTPHAVFVTKVGDIQVYDYAFNKMMTSKKVFRKNVSVTNIKFHPLGELVFFGVQDGHIYLRHSYSWLNVQPPLLSSNSAIQKMCFSADGSFLAAGDSAGLIAVYHFDTHRNQWTTFGKSMPHTKDVVDLKFTTDPLSSTNRLFSLGADRRLIEYDLYEHGSGSLTILRVFFVEQTCVPTSMAFECPEEFGEHCVLIHNKINKFRIFDYDQGKVMKTCQGPLFGGEKIQKLITLKLAYTQSANSTPKKLIAFSVDNKLGLLTTPVDGNPNRYMAILAHPENILDICVSPNQQYVFTIGKNDKCVYVWEPTIQSAEAAVLLGGTGINPFCHILKQHWPKQDIVRDIDLSIFHLNLKRVKTQSEMISMAKTVRLNEMAAVCRTCGFFLTEYEIDVMLTEAMFMIHLRGATDDEVRFDEFIKMFANHYYVTNQDDIQWAFSVLGKSTDDDGMYIPGDWFLHFMCARGEPMIRKDFEELFAKILIRSPGATRKSKLSSEINFAISGTRETKVDGPSESIFSTAFGNKNPGVEKQTEHKVAAPTTENILKDDRGDDPEARQQSTKMFANYEESTMLPLPKKIELLKFLDVIFPSVCQETMAWEEKEKDENKDLQKLAHSRSKRALQSETTYSRTKERERKRFYVEKTKCLLSEDTPLREKLLCAFEAQIFRLTGKIIGHEEILDGAKAYLAQQGTHHVEQKRKSEDISDSVSSKSSEEINLEEEATIHNLIEKAESDRAQEHEEEEEEESDELSLEDEDDEEHHDWTDPMEIITAEEDETWLDTHTAEDEHHGFEEEEHPDDLKNLHMDEVGHPDEYLSVGEGDTLNTEEEL